MGHVVWRSTFIQSISGCLSQRGKTKIQTDQSNAGYIETLVSTENLIGQFGITFFRDGTSDLKSSVTVYINSAFI